MIPDLLEDIKKNLGNLDYLRSLIVPITSREKPRVLNRSALMVSAHNIKHLNKIDKLACDNIQINLEDGVAKEQKKTARVLAALFISRKKDIDKQVVVRVNPLDETGLEDIKEINRVLPHAIRIPKVRTREDVLKALKAVDERIDIHISCETKEAFNAIASLKVDKRVTTIYLGILDLLADLGLPHSVITPGNPTMEYILSKFLVDAKTAGFIPYSFVYQEYKNQETFKNWCLLEKSMGFNGKGCISPGQVENANEVFSPSKEEIKKAEEIVKLFEEKKDAGITGFVSEEYGFIDEPIYRGARVVLNSIGA